MVSEFNIDKINAAIKIKFMQIIIIIIIFRESTKVKYMTTVDSMT